MNKYSPKIEIITRATTKVPLKLKLGQMTYLCKQAKTVFDKVRAG